uniref:Uncharacterized protein n=1 Tax=Acrobeloides nanus TaxID=290746 RepID=A0A914DH73_9BILA
MFFRASVILAALLIVAISIIETQGAIYGSPYGYSNYGYNYYGGDFPYNGFGYFYRRSYNPYHFNSGRNG